MIRRDPTAPGDRRRLAALAVAISRRAQSVRSSSSRPRIVIVEIAVPRPDIAQLFWSATDMAFSEEQSATPCCAARRAAADPVCDPGRTGSAGFASIPTDAAGEIFIRRVQILDSSGAGRVDVPADQASPGEPDRPFIQTAMGSGS